MRVQKKNYFYLINLIIMIINDFELDLTSDLQNGEIDI